MHRAIFSIFCHKRRFIASQSGATIVLVAIMLPLLIAGMALSVDVARLYLVQTKAQSALDNAMLGSVATENNVPQIITEATRLFNANFPSGYMGSTIPAGINVVESPANVFTGVITVSVPTSILKPITRRTVFNPNSQVTRGFQNSTQRTLEMAVVIDNSTSMTAAKLTDVRNGINAMMGNLFGTTTTATNIFISLVPFTNAVNIGVGREAWIQPNFRALYTVLSRILSGRIGFVSNRNQDSPPNGFNDFTNIAPTTAAGQFRITRNIRSFGPTPDNINIFLAPIRFALSSRTQITTELAAMSSRVASLRINVGLMWGWFTLSPTWQGIWGAPTTRPAAANTNLNKALVLVVGGKNNVFLGTNGTSNDDTSTATLCSLIKAQGIRIYVIAYNTSAAAINAAQLSACASSMTDYYFVTTPTALNNAFLTINNNSSAATVRLTR